MNVKGTGYDPSAWLNSYKDSKKPATTEAKPSQTGKTDTFTPSAKPSASDFSTTSDYKSYLTQAYPSIKNSNISISDTVLQQAMNDPEKEKVLTDFLKEMDGAMAYEAEQIKNLGDDTYNYKLDNFTITLDEIAEDNSGVIGTKFSEITVGRNDGTRISDDEFENAKTTVHDLFDSMEAQRKEHTKMLEKHLVKPMDKKDLEAKMAAKKEAKAEAAEKLAESRAEKKEQEEKRMEAK